MTTNFFEAKNWTLSSTASRPCPLPISPHPRPARHHSTAWARCSPIAFDPARCHAAATSGPAELGAVNPDAVHDHGQSTCQRHDRLLHPAAPGDLHRPGLEPRPFLYAACSELLRSVTRIISSPQRDILPLRSISPDWYLEHVSPNTAPLLGFAEPSGTSTWRDRSAPPPGRHRCRYQAPAHLIVPHDGQQTAMQDDELLAKDPPDNEQRFDQLSQVRQFSTSSLMRASNFTLPTIPTLRPKLRKVPRRSFSMRSPSTAAAGDRSTASAASTA